MPVEWPGLKTWTVGELGRAADLNAYLRDAIDYLSNPPRCALRLTAAQAVANATDHTISWDEAVWDSHGDMWDVGAPSTVTCTRDGLLLFNLTDEWAETANGGKRAARLHKNGSQLRKFHESSADGVSPFASSNSIITNCLDGDSFTVVTRQLSGASLDLAATRTVLNVIWIALPPASGE